MRLLRLSEVEMSPRDRVFYYSRTWAVALVNGGGAAIRWGLYGLLATVRPERYAGPRDNWGKWAPVHLRALRRRSTLEQLR